MIYVVKPIDKNNGDNERLDEILSNSIEKTQIKYTLISTFEQFKEMDMKNQKLMFVLDIGHSGINVEHMKILQHIRTNKTIFEGSVGAVIVDGNSEMYTKSVARELIYTANMSGCEFFGRPMVEATGTLKNFSVQAKVDGVTFTQAYEKACLNLILRLDNHSRVRDAGEKPKKLLALHSSNFKTSNTLLLWQMIRENLNDFLIQEIGLNNGTIADCRGCTHKTCMHFSEKNSCFYGGQIVDEVYPALLECDGLVMICPNYNDAIGANMTAFINRLTALFKTNKFYEKKLFAIIVSGYSGSDIVAEQIMGGININKTFILPPYFAICETANDVKEIYQCEDIVEKGRNFAENIRQAFN